MCTVFVEFFSSLYPPELEEIGKSESRKVRKSGILDDEPKAERPGG